MTWPLLRGNAEPDVDRAQSSAGEPLSVLAPASGGEHGDATASGGTSDAKGLLLRLKGRDGLFGIFSSLTTAQLCGAALGFVYWTLAARIFPSDQVGPAAAATSTMLLLGVFGSLGVGTLLVSELPAASPEDRPALMSTGLGVVALASSVLGLGWSLLAPLLGRSFSAAGGSVATDLVFVLGVTATGVNLAFSYAAIGIRRQRAQLVQNVLATGGKVVLVPVVASLGVHSGLGLVTAWTVALVVSIVLTIPMLGLHRSRPARRVGLAARRALIATHRRAALHHYLLNLAVGSAGLLLPVIVALVLSPQEVAYFSVGRLISMIVLMLPYYLTIALFAVATDESALRSRVRHTLAAGLGVNAVIAVVLVPAAPFVLRIFGGAYAAHGTTSFRLLILAGPLLVFKDHYIAIRRSQARLPRAIRLATFGVVIESASAAVGGTLWGLDGFCLCWLGALALETLIVMPIVAETAFGWKRRTWAGAWL